MIRPRIIRGDPPFPQWVSVVALIVVIAAIAVFAAIVFDLRFP